ncbi:hypothetical protein [Candidatus Korobacter versatilis]|nr:hypothetical protein [Candidatus Koribacter versatilis]
MKRLLIIILLLPCVASAKAKLLTSWKSPAAATHAYKKVLIIGMSPNPGHRADFEDDLAAALTANHVEVVPGNQLLLRPEGAVMDPNYIREQIKANHIDAVIVARLVSIHESVTYVPPQAMAPYPYYGSFYGYYGYVAPIVCTPGYLREEKKVRVEGNFYGVAGDDTVLLWTGTSDTFNPKNADKVIKGVVELFSGELRKDGFF